MPWHRFPLLPARLLLPGDAVELFTTIPRRPILGAHATHHPPTRHLAKHHHPAARPAAPRPDLSFLFCMCLNPKMGLDKKSYQDAATALGVDTATIEAVATVETAGKAFDAEGRPRILFERHYFHRLTHGRYDRTHPGISSKLRGGYGKSSAQYKRLETAYKLDPGAALESASWGRFQIMGSNFRTAGYGSVEQFVLALCRSEAAHLLAFMNFVLAHDTMHRALQKKDWAGFARQYNGSGYRDNDYDGKLKRAYEKLTAPQSSHSSKPSPAHSSHPPQPQPRR